MRSLWSFQPSHAPEHSNPPSPAQYYKHRTSFHTKGNTRPRMCKLSPPRSPASPGDGLSQVLRSPWFQSNPIQSSSIKCNPIRSNPRQQNPIPANMCMVINDGHDDGPAAAARTTTTTITNHNTSTANKQQHHRRLRR